MKRIGLSILLGILAIFIVACGNNADENKEGSEGKKEDTVTITHELGETPVNKNPEKVISFDFGILDSLDVLGVEVVGLPQMNVPSYLSKYEDEKYENVGSLKEPDFEKIADMQPDLIIISGRQADLYEQFTEIAPTIYLAVDTANYMDSFTNNMKTLGTIFGKESEIDEKLTAIEESINSLNEKASSSDKKALIILANEGKISAYGPNSRFGILHDVFGLKASDENIEVSTHGQSVSFEYIKEQNPDYLYVIDRGAAIGEESSAKQVVENELVESTNAYKDDNIVYLDPNYWYLSGGGLESVQEMIKEVEESVK